ncbi:MAG: hypothetical protein N4A37_00950 [Prolixibacteraceae bacterium]|jgi:hypothetical protein|nr:hypothetical protein [Prolixibacteraceae bacterium]
MGTVLGNDIVVNNDLGVSTDFTAEVFWEEYSKHLTPELAESVVVSCHGMNQRIDSQDILGLEEKCYPIDQDLKPYVSLHLSRNSIYHLLPEALFHPLVVSDASMSNKEVVEAIRANRNKEKRSLDFFRFFDTELFKEKVVIKHRVLSFLSDRENSKTFIKIARTLFDVNIGIEDDGLYWFFLKLCFSEQIKEDFQQIESLLCHALGFEVTTRLTPQKICSIPYTSLGDGYLGIDTGLDGVIFSDIEDVIVVVTVDKKEYSFEYLQKLEGVIETILGFFVDAGRDIYVEYQFSCKDEDEGLGSHLLGYDTYLE